MHQAQNAVVTAAREHADAYRDGQERPLGGYATVLAVFASCVAAAVGLAFATGRKLPSGVGAWDVVLLAAGTHKLSRTVSKSAVTSPLRAPFTRYTGTGGPSEVMEEVRSTGGRWHSIAELITCPFCLDVWVVTGFTIGLVSRRALLASCPARSPHSPGPTSCTWPTRQPRSGTDRGCGSPPISCRTSCGEIARHGNDAIGLAVEPVVRAA
jgi:hypothetical protein